MLKQIDMEGLRKEDAKWKPQKTNEMSSKLSQLFNDTASALTVNYMRNLGLGNPKNEFHPFQAAMTRRMTEALSVCYVTPALRTLVDPKTRIAYADDSDEMDSLNRAFEASSYDLLWKVIDGSRNLFRTVIVEWIEDHASGAVSAYIFPPHLVQRWPNPNSPSTIETDRYVALQIRYGMDPRDNLYRVWTRETKDGNWAAAIVNEKGETVEEQPFGDQQSPYGKTLPLQMIFDEPPLGQPWFPVPESRIAWALGINAQVNDLALLIQLEAHTNKVFKSEQTGQAPRQIGPDDVIEVVGEKADFRVEKNHPHILESSQVVDQMLRIWALGESLPGDTFMSDGKPQTGQALKVKERDLAARRARQALLVPIQERAAWGRYVAIHNRNAAAWDAKPLPADAMLRASPGRSWQPVDPVELQNVSFRDLATGFMSRIDYAMERFGMTRREAIAHLERVRDDNKKFPLTEFQNPDAVIDQRAASPAGAAAGKPSLTPGLETAQKAPGAMNPAIGTSTEGASVTQAVVTNLSSTDRPSR